MKDTLEIYAMTTTNASTPLARTYSKAAEQINDCMLPILSLSLLSRHILTPCKVCGADYAKENLILQEENTSSHIFAGPLSLITAAVIAALLAV